MKTKPDVVLSVVYSARIKCILALLRCVNPHATEDTELTKCSAALDEASTVYGPASAAEVCSALAELLRIVALLVQWRRAILDAVADHDRFLRAANARCSLWLNAYGEKETARPLISVATAIQAIRSFEDVGSVCRLLASVPLPVGVFAAPERASRAWIPPSTAENSEAELSVAFLQFSIDGVLAGELEYLSPCEAHDLELEVRVSRWPDDAELLRLSPISIEAPSTYDFPVFEFLRPTGNPPFKLRQRGRSVIKIAQSLRALPFEFKYSAEFLPNTAEQPIAVVGQRSLCIEGIDVRSAPLTGYQHIDRKLLRLRDSLRSKSLINRDDLTDVMTILKPLANLAGRAVQDAEFKGNIPEADFQVLLRRELRTHGEVSSELEEHAHAAGGITDLSFRGIAIELKAVTTKRLTLKDCEKFVDQTVAYAVAKGRRIAVLCILDCSPKTTPAYPPEEGIDILERPTPTGAIYVATVLIQGNLPRPSDLSR